MSSYNNSKILNNTELINSFNQPMSSKKANLRINNDYPLKIKKVIPLLQQGYKNAMSIKAQYLNNKLKKNINQGLNENNGQSNDSNIKRFNKLYKSSTSCNNSKINYYSKRRAEFENDINMGIETPQLYGRNTYNSLGKNNWSSFSFTDGYNKINYMKISNKYENNNINANYYIKFNNLKDDNDAQSNKLNGCDLNQLKSYGIKYCIDENGNPMNIVDIKLKNKKPIAYIIQKKDKNILVDLDNNTINPNYNGDYNLPQKPYFIIRKYDVQYPELRCNDIKEKNNLNYQKINTQNNNYISIDVNDSNKILFNKINCTINKERIRRKINKSCNLNFSNIINKEKGQNTFIGKIENKDKDRKNVLSPDIREKLNSFNLIKNRLKKKRKYIFINKIIEDNRSMQLKLKISNDNIINTINSLNNLSQREDNKNKFNTIIKESENENNENNHKLIIKNLNKVKIKSNNLKNIKFFTKKEIKNLEFKFERKYKNNKKSDANSVSTSFFNNFKNSHKTENQKEKNKTLKIDKSYNIPGNKLKNQTRLLVEKIDNLNLKKCKQQRYSYSLNEFMFNNIEKPQNKLKTNNNMLNTLSTFSHSFVSPPTETASFTTIQNIQNELNKNKKNITLDRAKDASHIKKFNTFKLHLMTKLNPKKICHKRIKTDNIINGEKKYRFFKSITENYKKNSNNFSFKQGNNTELYNSLKNSEHNSCNDTNRVININNTDINNSVCKCPYCHHFFYG